MEVDTEDGQIDKISGECRKEGGRQEEGRGERQKSGERGRGANEPSPSNNRAGVQTTELKQSEAPETELKTGAHEP